ncbi:putative holin-like toxin [Paenilisteria newyorkensis]|nr:putative holin-like toxin [Listeria newyorkensis]WAO20611.1 putative holin-like toxin [Listeria newyorkensis]
MSVAESIMMALGVGMFILSFLKLVIVIVQAMKDDK